MTAYKIHAIEICPTRRVQLAGLFLSNEMHCEIYDGIDEFLGHLPSDGIILLGDDGSRYSSSVFERLQAGNGFGLPIICYSSDPSPDLIVSAMKNDAMDFLQFPFEINRFFDCLRRNDIESTTARRKLVIEAAQLVKSLTTREFEVLTGMVEGGSNKMIARSLEISPRTVEIHRANMMEKLQCKTMAEALVIGVFAGLCKPPECLPGFSKFREKRLHVATTNGQPPYRHTERLQMRG